MSEPEMKYVGSQFVPSQHNRPDVRKILDDSTLHTQEQNLRHIKIQRDKMLQEFQKFKSNEIRDREKMQKEYYDSLHQMI